MAHQHCFYRTYLLAASSILLLLLLPGGVMAGYDFTISQSSVDPDVNTSAQNIGVDSLFVWVKCAEQGLSAFEATLSSDMAYLGGFSAFPGVLNAGSGTALRLALGSCPTGDSVNVALGWFVVIDSDSSGGYVRLDPAPSGAIVAVSCDSTMYVYPYEARAVGFRSGGGSPDTTGSELGCGLFPDMMARDPSVLELGLGGWSEKFNQPSSGGEGADAPITLMRRLKSNSNDLIVGGSFGQVGSVTGVEGIARFNSRNDSLQGAWASVGTPPQLTAGTHLAADEKPTGELAVGGSTAPPFKYWNGSSWAGSSPDVFGVDPDPIMYGIEHWSTNDKFLVVGDWHDPDSWNFGDRYSGLAQYNPAATPVPWEPFGYPQIGTSVNYWMETGDRVTAVAEINLGPSAGAIVIGGDFDYVHGNDWATSTDKTFSTTNAAWLDASGVFHAGSLPGPTFDFETRPGTLQTLYAAGSFGHVDGSENPRVWALDTQTAPLGAWAPLEGGGGPLMKGLDSAIINDLFVYNGWLFAVGDFDRVLTKSPGGDMEFAGGFARYSIAGNFWQSLGLNALGDVGHAGERMSVGVVAGGDFQTVENGAIASYHMGLYWTPEREVTTFVPPSLVDRNLPPTEFEVVGGNPTKSAIQFYVAISRASAVSLESMMWRGDESGCYAKATR